MHRRYEDRGILLYSCIQSEVPENELESAFRMYLWELFQQSSQQ